MCFSSYRNIFIGAPRNEFESAMVNEPSVFEILKFDGTLFHCSFVFSFSAHRSKAVLFVLRFYGPVNPMGSCRARSVYLTTRLPLSG